MRFRFYLCFILFCLSGASSAHAAIMDACPETLPDATIRVAISMYDPPVYQHYSIDELTRVPSSPSPYPSDAITHTYGLTKNPLNFSVKSQIASSLNRLTQKKCYWYDSIDLTLEVKPEIYMGKEIKPGTCYYDAVLKHELEHANIERRLLNDYQTIITTTITNFVRNVGFMRDIDAGNDEKVYAHLRQSLSHQMDVIHAHMEPVRAARQGQIDTAQSYDATAAPCRNVEPLPY